MLLIDPHSPTPIYQQIKEQCILLIRTGVFLPGDQLPSLRSLASDLHLNVNTVKRAFQELEADRVVVSLPGRGVFVADQTSAQKNIIQKTLDDLRPVLASAYAKGVPKEQLHQLIEEIYKEEDKP